MKRIQHTPLKFNQRLTASSPLKSYQNPKRKGSSSNHHFHGRTVKLQGTSSNGRCEKIHIWLLNLRGKGTNISPQISLRKNYHINCFPGFLNHQQYVWINEFPAFPFWWDMIVCSTKFIYFKVACLDRRTPCICKSCLFQILIQLFLIPT